MGIPTGVRSGNNSLTEDQRLALQAKILEIDGGVSRQKIRRLGDGSRIIQQYNPKDKDRKALNLSADQGLSLGHYEDFKTAVKQAAGTPLTSRQAALISIFGNSNKHGEGRNVFAEDPTFQQKLNAIVQGTGQNGTAIRRKVITVGVTSVSKAIRDALGAHAGQAESLTLGSSRASNPAAASRDEARVVAEVTGQPSLGLGLYTAMVTAVKKVSGPVVSSSAPVLASTAAPIPASVPPRDPSSSPLPAPVARPRPIASSSQPRSLGPSVSLEKKELENLLTVTVEFRRFRYAAEGKPQHGEKSVLDDLELSLRKSLDDLKKYSFTAIDFSSEKLKKGLEICQKFAALHIPTPLGTEYEGFAGLASKILINPKFKDFIPPARPAPASKPKPIRAVVPALAVPPAKSEATSPVAPTPTPTPVISSVVPVVPTPSFETVDPVPIANLSRIASDMLDAAKAKAITKVPQFRAAAEAYYRSQPMTGRPASFEAAMANNGWLLAALKTADPRQVWNRTKIDKLTGILSAVKAAAPGSREIKIPSDDRAASASDYMTPPAVLSGQGEAPPAPPASQDPTEAHLRTLAKDLAQKLSAGKLQNKAREFYSAAWNYYVGKNPRASESDFQQALKNDKWLQGVLTIGNNGKAIDRAEFETFKRNFSVVKGAPKVQDHSKTGSTKEAKE